MKSENECTTARDNVIRALWCAFRNLADVLDADEWTDEDLDLWTQVTQHSAVQSRLHLAAKKEPQPARKDETPAGAGAGESSRR